MPKRKSVADLGNDNVSENTSGLIENGDSGDVAEVLFVPEDDNSDVEELSNTEVDGNVNFISETIRYTKVYENLNSTAKKLEESYKYKWQNGIKNIFH